MKERPILFSGPMVRAILEGRKIETRRIVTVPWKGRKRLLPYSPYWGDLEDTTLTFTDGSGDELDALDVLGRPYGAPGDRLWVRETFWTDGTCCTEYRADARDDISLEEVKRALRVDRWKPSIFMPRSLSRLTLEVTSVRIERLQTITAASAVAEGVVDPSHGWDGNAAYPLARFRSLWDSINGERAAWDDNPWVWVIGFRRLDAQLARSA